MAALPTGRRLNSDFPWSSCPQTAGSPAAAMHHHASFGLADIDHPFIHVMVDHGEFAPDAWDVNASEAGMAT